MPRSKPWHSTLKPRGLHSNNGYSYLDEGCGDELIHLLKFNRSLTKLDFSNQCIHSDLLYKVASGLGENTTLQVLDLTGIRPCAGEVNYYRSIESHTIGSALAKIIGNSGSLSSLLAFHQCLDDIDAGAIAVALKKNVSLTELRLADNKLDERGSAAIFDAVRKNRNTALRTLDLFGCRIDRGTAESLAKLLKKNRSLTELAIGTVRDPIDLQRIRKGLSKNKSIVTLRFTWMPNPDEKLQEVAQQIDADLKRRNLAAVQSGVPADTAGSTSATTVTGHIDTKKGPG